MRERIEGSLRQGFYRSIVIVLDKEIIIRISMIGDSYTASGHQEFYHPFQISYDVSLCLKIEMCTHIS